ncbi:unnamed protein product, partial [Ascophyllum nodosum]
NTDAGNEYHNGCDTADQTLALAGRHRRCGQLIRRYGGRRRCYRAHGAYAGGLGRPQRWRLRLHGREVRFWRDREVAVPG